MSTEEWKAWKAAGGHHVTYVGMFDNARVRGSLLTVSKSGVRVRTDAGVQVFHPDDIRPGWV